MFDNFNCQINATPSVANLTCPSTVCFGIIYSDRSIKMTWKQVNLGLINFVQELTLQEAETIALSILKQVMEEKVKLKCMHFQLFAPPPEMENKV